MANVRLWSCGAPTTSILDVLTTSDFIEQFNATAKHILVYKHSRTKDNSIKIKLLYALIVFYILNKSENATLQ